MTKFSFILAAVLLMVLFSLPAAFAQDDRDALPSAPVKVSEIEKLQIQLTAKDAEVLKAQMALLEEKFKHLETIIGGQIGAARKAHNVEEAWKYDIAAGQFQKAEAADVAGASLPAQRRKPVAPNKHP